MKILHTSDWHLGRALYGRKRYEEFSAFLEWLSNTIEKEDIDMLLVAGDVFDTTTPSNRAQELYYRFLFRVSTSCCRHVVIIAGNHDSPTFLEAPKELLRILHVHVVGTMSAYPEDEVITIFDEQEQPQAIICAVPYLRDRDIRTVEPGETIDDKNQKLIEGLKQHYMEVCAIAEQKQVEYANHGHPDIPIIAMGHLFTAGGKTTEGDGNRGLYVGSLAHVGKEVFPSSINYLALGHLHVPQCVSHTEHIRYSGSPIPMGYGEANQHKIVIAVTFDRKTPVINEIEVPCFQQLERITGSIADINEKIKALKAAESNAWLEIEYTGEDITGNLRELLDESLAGSALEIRRVKNKRVMDRVITAAQHEETLDDLNESDVFARYLDAYNIPEEERGELTASYNEILHALHEEDVNAE